jgi:Flp pilus assembly protein TadG
MFAKVFAWIRGERGNVAGVMALMLVPVVGALGMGVEASNWYFLSRATQNAADSAAIAAADNAVSTQFQTEGRANAQSYGFTNGSGGATVTVTSGVTCPDATSACYQAVVTKVVPIYLTAVVGFTGDTTLSGRPAKTITSTALAEPISKISYPACLTATGNDSGGDGVSTKGAPFSNMPGCAIAATGASSKVDCNGQGIGGNPSIFATSTIASACTSGLEAANQSSSAYVDPYANDYKNIPCSVSGGTSPNCASGAVTCSAYAGTLTAGACYSGDISLSSQTLNPSSPSVIYIKNGSINLDNAALTSTNVTFVFTGATPGGFTGGKKGSLNLTAPTSGTWSGIAAYQDTSLAASTYTASSWSDNGNSPTVDIIGLLYLPRTDVSFGGGAGATTGTSSCFVAVVHSFDTNGTAFSMTRSGCTADGLGNIPTIQLVRAALVQ